MDTATEDPRGCHSRTDSSDPHFFRDAQMFVSDDEGGYISQMGSARRDARVVCESFSSGRVFSSAASPKSRQVGGGQQKGPKAVSRRRSMAYSRNPLLACFLGESVLSSRAMNLSPSCDPQRTFFSLIPIDTSRVNENTGEPQSPQLSCIGQVKHRQCKVPKTSDTITEDLARMDINDGIIPHSMRMSKAPAEAGIVKEVPYSLQKEDSFRVQKGSFRLQKEESFRVQLEESLNLHKVETFKLRKEESFKVQKEESFKRLKEESLRLQKELSFKLQRKEKPLPLAFDAIPHLDLGGENLSRSDLPHLDPCSGQKAARLMRSRRGLDEEKKTDEEEKVSSPSQRHSIRHINHFLKQKLGASMVKSGFVCGWSSGEASPRSPRSDRSEPESEHCEIDLSRFAAGELQPKTPSFKDSRSSLHILGKKLADIRVHAQQIESIDRRSWKDEMQGKEQNDVSITAPLDGTVDSSTIIIRCSPAKVILRPATEAPLWKRRCMPRPLRQEACT